MTKKNRKKERKTKVVDQAMATIKVGLGYKSVNITFWSKPRKAA